MRFSCLNNPDNNKGWQKFNANLLLFICLSNCSLSTFINTNVMYCPTPIQSSTIFCNSFSPLLLLSVSSSISIASWFFFLLLSLLIFLLLPFFFIKLIISFVRFKLCILSFNSSKRFCVYAISSI